MKTLDEIALTTGAGCDKGSDRHNYCSHYEAAFGHLRDKPIKFLEIGVEFGLSAKVWLEYFPYALIFGVDIKRQHNLHHPRFVFMEGDQRDRSFWFRLLSEHGSDWDVIIDDGCHHTSGIMMAFEYLWPCLNPGGIYIIEDLMCSYYDSCAEPGYPPQVEFLKTLVDEVNCQTRYVNTPEPRRFNAGIRGTLGIDWIRFSEELCIIKKK